MGIGIALGGVSEGINAGLDRSLKTKELDFRKMAQSQDVGLASRGLDIRQNELDRNAQADLEARIAKNIENSSKVISETVKAAIANGTPPEKIKSVIEPLVANVETAMKSVGTDPTQFRQQVDLMIQTPPELEGTKIGATLEGVKSKIAKGETLTPGQQKLYDDSLKHDAMLAALLGGGNASTAEAPTGEGATPGPTPTPVKTETVPGAAPALPANLVGKGAKWSPSKQRWYTPDGFSFNQQGIPAG